MRIKKVDKWKTAFRCGYDLFKYTALPFELVNGPATFHSMINHIFRDRCDIGMIACMEDSIIHSQTRENHDETVLEVVERLCDNR